MFDWLTARAAPQSPATTHKQKEEEEDEDGRHHQPHQQQHWWLLAWLATHVQFSCQNMAHDSALFRIKYCKRPATIQKEEEEENDAIKMIEPIGLQ